MALFRDRVDAGRRLAAELSAYAGRSDVIVLGLPRGGIPVAEQVAAALGADLDTFIVRKVGVPGHEELAMGAVASGGVRVVNYDVVEHLGISDEMFQRAAAQEMVEVELSEHAYRGDRGLLQLSDKTVILVDDGLATGASMRAAVEAARRNGAAWVAVAVPVAPASSCEELTSIADAVICATTPNRSSPSDSGTKTSRRRPTTKYGRRWRGIGGRKDDRSRQRPGCNSARAIMAGRELEADIPIDHEHITGTLVIPDRPRGLVLFAHGSGSSRFSPRNRSWRSDCSAPDSGRCCSISSRPRRRRSMRRPVAFASTSSSSPAA